VTLAIREGLTYSPRWFDQQEGPYTYLAKLAIANRTSLTTLLAAIFGVRGSSASSTLRTHSLTCVEDRWMKRGGRATAGSIAQSLSQRTLSDVFGDWTASSSMAGNDIHLGRLAGDECRCLVGHGDGSG